ncbi:Pc13g01830 [Penicillium rubens Wisconsin 54-1255]|uniref:Pc13g01830 protein n=1 Tax=Penicillium rubens (strain ATCC 28089 / DSM 1075 / NRRL 1951 / Wisconsin 54-1255) TaxID=500485 RepID=B6H1U3_PENRW|nr:Pc13g01830 [Penicillium rubens Wisconsin 54-1255]
MSTPPDIDPYAVLGVAKEATIPEIRAAHRKRVLKCHPDKIQDESQRIAAQDEFQKVQQAYELLSDDVRRTKHDQKVKIAELKRELLERRRTEVPMEVFFEEAMRFTDEPRTMSRKFEDFGVRSKSKPTEEKKKARAPTSTYHQAKEKRETAKATHSDRAKTRDQERRRQRQAEAKYDSTFDVCAESDDASDSSVPRYAHKRTSTPRRERERDSRSRPSESSRRRERRYDEDDDISDHWQSKIESQYFNAEDYIASKTRKSKSPRRYHGHDSAEPESSTSRSAGRSTRTRRRSSSRDRSYEHLESPRAYEVKPPKMQPSATSPGIKVPLRPSFLNTRAATSSGFRQKRESRDSTLYEMAHEPLPSRTSKMRDRNDSGYSSPGTPEMLPRGTSPKTLYTVVQEADHVVVEPKSSKYRSARSPDRDRVPSTRQVPKRSSTFQAYTEAAPRVETRSARPSSRTHPVEYITTAPKGNVKYGRTYKPEDVSYSPRRDYYYDEEYRPPAVGRRQSAY